MISWFRTREPLGTTLNWDLSEMSTQNRRSSFSSSTSSSLAKRQASSENMGKAAAVPTHLAKKRAPLGNITNLKGAPHIASRGSVPSTMAPHATKNSKSKNCSIARNGSPTLQGSHLPAMVNVKSTSASPLNFTTFPKCEVIIPSLAAIPPPSSMDVSPSKSDGSSVSLDETMSTSDSFKSPEIEYLDNNEREALSNLHISDHHVDTTDGNLCNRNMLFDFQRDERFVDIDNNYEDPQMCAAIACDIYKHLRASEAKKRPSTDFMERIQKDLSANMRAILIDWLVEVAEEYRLIPDTLYLTVNYIDRYLSGNAMDRQRLQLLGVASMMIASKYEEICAPQVEEFCYITDNTYFKEEVLQMESSILNYLKFEMTAPTAKCFLRRFVRVAQGIDEAPSMQIECLACYLAELSLIEYNMLVYSPSLIAASAIFLAKFILFPTKRPWNSTLQHYTLYQPCDLRECVKNLHRLCCSSPNSSLPAIREKYSQHKYKQVARKHCPPVLPSEFFYNDEIQ